MTEEIFDIFYCRECEVTVVGRADGIVLDRTVFYPNGGGQPGDQGVRTTAGDVTIVDTLKGANGIRHAVEGVDLPAIGSQVTCAIDWARLPYMRMPVACMCCVRWWRGGNRWQVGPKSRLTSTFRANALI